MYNCLLTIFYKYSIFYRYVFVSYNFKSGSKIGSGNITYKVDTFNLQLAIELIKKDNDFDNDFDNVIIMLLLCRGNI